MKARGKMAVLERFSLECWRLLSAEESLCGFAEYAKKDASFNPFKHSQTTRCHAYAFGHELVLLLNGPNYWDARLQVGEGGALDLLTQLAHVNFKTTVRLLRDKQL